MIKESKKTNAGYWIFTVLTCVLLGGTAILDLMHDPEIVKAMRHLGYPDYVVNILGMGKVVGIVSILIPGFPRLKEWAYAGLTIDLVGAIMSHLFVGDGIDKIAPAALALVILLAGYILRPNNRKLIKAK